LHGSSDSQRHTDLDDEFDSNRSIFSVDDPRQNGPQHQRLIAFTGAFHITRLGCKDAVKWSEFGGQSRGRIVISRHRISTPVQTRAPSHR
jgi:hypothetical protein